MIHEPWESPKPAIAYTELVIPYANAHIVFLSRIRVECVGLCHAIADSFGLLSERLAKELPNVSIRPDVYSCGCIDSEIKKGGNGLCYAIVTR